MKTYHASIRSGRKALGFGLLLVLGLPAAALAQDTSMSTPSQAAANGDNAQTDKAMAQYVQAATQQLDAYRQEINVDPPLPREDAAGIAKDRLATCDELLTKLKETDASKFDTVKAQFEQARNALAQAVQAALRP